MERNGSYGATWADQWDYGGESAHGVRGASNNSNNKKSGMEKTKAVASTGFQKTKAVASTGFKKVKEGIQWSCLLEVVAAITNGAGQFSDNTLRAS
ncbi:hypothetical protein J5N97_019921 [Dioscorea zingiberensis]|uniref:Uncharacterized protein n=1 Tax=Dioscorea zingiberensis TaxID=325984 RepID=A0A9D5CES7_9LILI|nr:hypothetical protein J5N97_019921 [Dioscorea zingiberensis]